MLFLSDIYVDLVAVAIHNIIYMKHLYYNRANINMPQEVSSTSRIVSRFRVGTTIIRRVRFEGVARIKRLSIWCKIFSFLANVKLFCYIAYFHWNCVTCFSLNYRELCFISIPALPVPPSRLITVICHHGVNSSSFRCKLQLRKRRWVQVLGRNLPKMAPCVCLVLAALLSVTAAQFIPPVRDTSAQSLLCFCRL